MKKIIIFIVVCVVGLGSYFFMSKSPEKKESLKNITVYKSKTCRCCNKWISHMEDNGYNVVASDVSDVDVFKDKYGVPKEGRSCHTGIVAGYFIEGHVPAKDVIRLLKERPDILGLSVPEMPVGTPGMEMGNRKDAYDVIAYMKDGTQSIFSSYSK